MCRIARSRFWIRCPVRANPTARPQARSTKVTPTAKDRRASVWMKDPLPRTFEAARLRPSHAKKSSTRKAALLCMARTDEVRHFRTPSARALAPVDELGRLLGLGQLLLHALDLSVDLVRVGADAELTKRGGALGQAHERFDERLLRLVQLVHEERFLLVEKIFGVGRGRGHAVRP
eukprot:1303832-Pleurochrysis_carterae.AAC.2